jgi:hypothetical protein
MSEFNHELDLDAELEQLVAELAAENAQYEHLLPPASPPEDPQREIIDRLLKRREAFTREYLEARPEDHERRLHALQQMTEALRKIAKQPRKALLEHEGLHAFLDSFPRRDEIPE